MNMVSCLQAFIDEYKINPELLESNPQSKVTLTERLGISKDDFLMALCH